ncbi:hypothetical protein [Cohnella candidum]|uniref:Uncharacterized protein n=1 Tax=Cohnella candidum TaxID=2674991 RepID=A0A3G3JYZ4_9BACL|nr:hypothetical protein [Cohnella candidum]AYQ73413.1 hypothetical protein EAV92_13020 [Cohnella candidum]
MRKNVKINGKEMNVEFIGYYDSPYGELLFTQVMCDVFMPGNEVVPVEVEKEQIRRVVEAFKKRKALYDEVRQENVKGKSYYVINPRMRYDLGWLEGKQKVILSKDKPPVYEREGTALLNSAEPAKKESKPRMPSGSRREYLDKQGFRFNEATRNWEIGTIRFPDALVDKPVTDEEFIQGMTRLLEADRQKGRGSKGQPKTT